MATYIIKSGDTLSAIAKKLGTTVAALATANGIADPNKIYAGKTLTLPAAGAASGSTVKTTAPAAKTVDTTATNAAREAAVARGQSPNGIYVYKADYNTLGGGKNVTVDVPSSITPKVQISDELANDEYYKQLDPDNQSLVAYFSSILNSQNEDKTAAFKEALSQAGSQADPYWREIINTTKDELTRMIGDTDTDLAATERDLMLRKTRISEDLITNKNDLTLDQQTALAQQAKNLDSDILTTRETMASRGLSSSSIRNQAEERLNEANRDIVTGTKLDYERKIRDANTTALRSVVDIQNQIGDAATKATSSKTAVARKAEGYLGTNELSGMSGLSGLLAGGISGSIVEDKTNDILTRAQALMLTK